jgi:hypothetical protein
MEQIESKRHAWRALIYLLMLLSPLGAPMVGMMLIAACPIDTSVTPDGPFSMSVASCGVWERGERLYQGAFWLPTIASAKLIGTPLMLAWWTIAIVLPFGVVIHATRAVLSRVFDE